MQKIFPVVLDVDEQNNKLVGQSSNIVLSNYAALLVLLIDGRRVVKIYLLQILSEDETSEVASLLRCDKPLGQSSKDQNHKKT